MMIDYELVQEYIKNLDSIKINDLKKQELKSIIQKIKTSKSKNTKEQGDLLEILIEQILNSIEILDFKSNPRTSSNEIDFLVTLNQFGSYLKGQNRIPSWFPERLLIECKNYSKPVGITYVGKFKSLMDVTSIKFGLFISTKGITGASTKAWKDATGYIKKISLIHPNEVEKQIILDININMIENFLNNGYTFFEFLDKVRSEFLTDVYSDFNTAYFHELSEKLSTPST